MTVVCLELRQCCKSSSQINPIALSRFLRFGGKVSARTRWSAGFRALGVDELEHKQNLLLDQPLSLSQR